MGRIITFLTFFIFGYFTVVAQTDSTASTAPETKPATENSTSTDDSPKDFQTKGISVSPAHFHLTQKPGEVKTYKINVKNDTETAKRFKVNIYDFDMNGKGKSSFMSPGKGKYSLSRWLNISPTFIELQPGEHKEVKFTVSVPDNEDGNKSAWSIIMVEQEEPRKKLEPPSKSDNTVALGVIPTFAFGVFVYQNPPNVITDNVEITNFSYSEKDTTKIIAIEAANKGNGIAYCTSYIDLTNLNTGTQKRLTVKTFTILPELIRDFVFTLPKNLEKGNYLAIGVLDYENSEEIQAAKLNFEIK
ncbi:MAG: DUF916 domain-containing protein [Flavobacteriales bacterium]|nr:DUF916 domain-containing protein [Flavobacteriales bacterium]MCB9174927.1 DUF916 domain-containing protein [Flavobacteriales bacterium]